jgi:predicted nucleotide-binding protein
VRGRFVVIGIFLGEALQVWRETVVAEVPQVFVSYSRSDSELVHQIIDQLRTLGVRTWVDAEQLTPGESWERAISEALRNAKTILVFLSPTSVASRWIAAELDHALSSNVRVLPILLHVTPVAEMPLSLQNIQWLDATCFPAATKAQSTAFEIARVLQQWSSGQTTVQLDDRAREELGRAFAAQSKGVEVKPVAKAPDSVFIVHGHDEDLLHEVVRFTADLGIRAIVLKDVGGAARSLIDKFFEIGGSARFAIVLLSADDMGASRLQYDEPDVGTKALKYRSRQNVILELGYFYGLLGWDNVFVLEKPASRRFPDFERPSDLNGVVFDRYDAGGKWRSTIRNRLVDHGFTIRQLQS